MYKTCSGLCLQGDGTVRGCSWGVLHSQVSLGQLLLSESAIRLQPPMCGWVFFSLPLIMYQLNPDTEVLLPRVSASCREIFRLSSEPLFNFLASGRRRIEQVIAIAVGLLSPAFLGADTLFCVTLNLGRYLTTLPQFSMSNTWHKSVYSCFIQLG